MSSVDYAKSIDSYLIAEGRFITYRVLSRLVNVHVNEAKRMLWMYSQKNHKCHATYIISGYQQSAPRNVNTESDLDNMDDSGTSGPLSSMVSQVGRRVRTIKLCPEENLEGNRPASFRGY